MGLDYVWSQCEELPVGFLDSPIRIRKATGSGLIYPKVSAIV